MIISGSPSLFYNLFCLWSTFCFERRNRINVCVVHVFILSLNVFLKVSQFEKQLSSATLVCLDGNIPVSTIDYVCSIASKHSINGKHTEMVSKW